MHVQALASVILLIAVLQRALCDLPQKRLTVRMSQMTEKKVVNVQIMSQKRVPRFAQQRKENLAAQSEGAGRVRIGGNNDGGSLAIGTNGRRLLQGTTGGRSGQYATGGKMLSYAAGATNGGDEALRVSRMQAYGMGNSGQSVGGRYVIGGNGGYLGRRYVMGGTGQPFGGRYVVGGSGLQAQYGVRNMGQYGSSGIYGGNLGGRLVNAYQMQRIQGVPSMGVSGGYRRIGLSSTAIQPRAMRLAGIPAVEAMRVMGSRYMQGSGVSGARYALPVSSWGGMSSRMGGLSNMGTSITGGRLGRLRIGSLEGGDALTASGIGGGIGGASRMGGWSGLRGGGASAGSGSLLSGNGGIDGSGVLSGGSGSDAMVGIGGSGTGSGLGIGLGGHGKKSNGLAVDGDVVGSDALGAVEIGGDSSGSLGGSIHGGKVSGLGGGGGALGGAAGVGTGVEGYGSGLSVSGGVKGGGAEGGISVSGQSGHGSSSLHVGTHG
ncbi:uncharacterized protein LOC135400591 [Ornithodoros turicata]|uniref:uncharacterized protein LOC135400591 n=1 Tax=Ornithodoros turicata TaxID=34597 RepID=UPI003138E42C